MARLAVEKNLQRIALVTPQWRNLRDGHGGGIYHICSFLHAVGVAVTDETRKIERFSGKANKFVHGRLVNPKEAFALVDQATALRPKLNRLMEKALIMKEAQPVALVEGGAPC